MIGAQEIAFWRAHAPWSSDLMVEQDYLLSTAVAAIFDDPFLRAQVAMRGGTVLHKGHLAPPSRYSEDIDLVLVGDRPGGHVARAIHRVLQPLLGKPAETGRAKVRLAVRNLLSKSTLVRSTYVYTPTSTEAAQARLKVETNTNETEPCFPLVTTTIAAPDPGSAGVRQVQVVSYELNEMLGTKLRALLQREHGRDLFDLWLALQRGGADPARVAQAFRFYMDKEGSAFNAAQVRDALARRMRSKTFLNDMDGFLRPGLAYSPQQAHAEFCAVLLPHLG